MRRCRSLWHGPLSSCVSLQSFPLFFHFFLGSLSHRRPSSAGTSARSASVVARLHVNGRQDLAHALEERRYEQVCQAPPHHLHRRQQHHEALEQRHHQPAGGGSPESASEERRTVTLCSFDVFILYFTS